MPGDVAEKIHVNDYLELVEALKLRSMPEVRDYCKRMDNNLRKVHDHHYSFMENRENVNIDSARVEAEIKRLVAQAEDAGLVNWFNTFTSLQQKMEERFRELNFKF